MKASKLFESIRPYKNREVKDVINELTQEADFQKIISQVYPEKNISEILGKLHQISTVNEFQREVVHAYLRKVIEKTIGNLSFSGIENINPKKRYLFISNHRDIVLDPAILNIILIENDIRTTQIAIGSNLLIAPWIEMLEASKELSSYIKHTVFKKNNSVWIAQKEGRTKDGNDQTQPALLKMIHLSSKKTVSKYFSKLKVIPVSISYEIEPCDKLKTAETYARLTHGSYKKNPLEDLHSMAGGLHNDKGNLHFHFGKPLKSGLKKLDDIKFKSEQYVQLAKQIDKKIHKNYKLFANNFMAYDMITGQNKFSEKYTETQLKEFVNYMEERIKEIEGNKDEIRNIFLKIYANPVANKYKLEVL